MLSASARRVKQRARAHVGRSEPSASSLMSERDRAPRGRRAWGLRASRVVRGLGLQADRVFEVGDAIPEARAPGTVALGLDTQVCDAGATGRLPLLNEAPEVELRKRFARRRLDELRKQSSPAGDPGHRELNRVGPRGQPAPRENREEGRADEGGGGDGTE